MKHKHKHKHKRKHKAESLTELISAMAIFMAILAVIAEFFAMEIKIFAKLKHLDDYIFNSSFAINHEINKDNKKIILENLLIQNNEQKFNWLDNNTLEFVTLSNDKILIKRTN